MEVQNEEPGGNELAALLGAERVKQFHQVVASADIYDHGTKELELSRNEWEEREQGWGEARGDGEYKEKGNGENDETERVGGREDDGRCGKESSFAS